MRTEGLRVGDVTIDEIDFASLSDEEIEALNAYSKVMRAESSPDDPPVPLELTRLHVRNIPPMIAIHAFWAREPNGRLVASGEASFTHTDDNRHLLQAHISVHPERRRQGIAKAILRLIADVSESEGRPLLTGGTSERVPAGEEFARRIGADPGLESHTNRLQLPDVDQDMVRSWIDEGPGRAPDYRLWVLDGPYPDDRMDEIAEMHRVMNTAPRDENVEDWEFKAEHIRQWEQSMMATGEERWSIFALHEPTGELAGFTEVVWNPKMPKTVWQMATGVKPGHRGHGLGRWVKAVMIRRVLDERTDAEDVRTGNADSNEHMLAINDRLGFKRYRAHTSWQVKVERVREYLAGR